MIDAYHGRSVPQIVVNEVSGAILPKEFVRDLFTWPWIGLFTDLFFSPVHRIAHAFVYAKIHTSAIIVTRPN